jgi:serine/threonine protein kinase/Flp pilus assembly protein TadD
MSVKDMTPARWHEASAALDVVLELDPDSRRIYLSELAAKDQRLSEEVASLLAALAAGGSGFLSTSAAANLPHPPPVSGLESGRRVGPYELERLLGTGGMAEVWLAKRVDGAFEREVALKLPMVSRLRKDLEERFTRERDILAKLEHANIARLYDGGVDAQGLPYLAMEYVPGQSLICWCDEHQLGIPARLTLFLSVLEALQYAHDKQVIHRDIKPSNILASESGQVRLLDFGVAKLLAEEGETQLTSVYGRALTPEYASPEFLQGESIDARSDIYSAGVVLHELLSGVRPYRLKEASLETLKQAIATVEAKKPSTQLSEDAAAARGTTNEKLARELRGDLDVITLKAIAKEPSERYESAQAMADDVERHLQHRPIRARPASVSYRLKRFVQRNRPMIGVSAAAGVLLLAIGGYEIEHRLAAPTVFPAPAFHPPPHSIAVLPFVNLSGDKQQEYFSDGLTEELLNSLTEIDDLQVAARTSAFSFKGTNTDIATIARKLQVGTVLEGSVRRSEHTIRITAQLINATTGFHLWSKTYDRDLGDVLKLQTEIAGAVASALKVTLLGDVAAKVELGGTRNPAAFDAYLRGAKANSSIRDTKDLPSAIAAYSEAIRLDPQYALAFAGRSIALSIAASEAETAAAVREGFDKAQADARQALALAPDLAQAHLAMGLVSVGTLDFTQASEAYERALALAPGNAEVLRRSGYLAARMGHFDAGVAAARRAVVLDPLARQTHSALGSALYLARRYQEAVAAFSEVISLAPDVEETYAARGLAYYGLGDLERARASCETKPEEWDSQQCLAVIYDKLGRHADAEAELAKEKAATGDTGAYQYATIYAQSGDRRKALEWLETASRLRDPGLIELKTDPLMDPLRKEPRFQAIERTLKFPS